MSIKTKTINIAKRSYKLDIMHMLKNGYSGFLSQNIIRIELLKFITKDLKKC